MSQDLQSVKVSIKDQNQNELDAGDYRGIEIDFTPPGPAEVKIDLDGNSTLTTQKQKFQVTFPGQDITRIKGANYVEPDNYTQIYKGNANTITIEESSGSNSIEVIYVTSTSDGTGWRQLDLVNNPSQVVLSVKPDGSDIKGDYIDPKYPSLTNSPYYRLPKEGNVIDKDKFIDEGAKKWKLTRQEDHSVLVEGKTIRLKIYAGKVLGSGEPILKEIKKINPKAEYNIARQHGYWCPTDIPQWKNIEITSYITFEKSPREDPFVGYVVRSCVHDLKGEKDIESLPEAYQCGSAYHSNVAGNGELEEKIEAFHAAYTKIDRSKIKPNGLPKFKDLHNKKIGFKWCLFNIRDSTNKVVKVRSETYFDFNNSGKFTLSWFCEYDGSETSSSTHNKCGLIEWGSPYVILKSNDTKYRLHDLEVREIVEQRL
jgi:hypothetical protein